MRLIWSGAGAICHISRGPELEKSQTRIIVSGVCARRFAFCDICANVKPHLFNRDERECLAEAVPSSQVRGGGAWAHWGAATAGTGTKGAGKRQRRRLKKEINGRRKGKTGRAALRAGHSFAVVRLGNSHSPVFNGWIVARIEENGQRATRSAMKALTNIQRNASGALPSF